MKITKVDIYMLDATAQRASRRPICCRVWTDDGFYGDGEAGIAFDYAAPAGIGMLQDISRLIIGKDPMRTDELWERMFKISFWGQGGGPVVFAAISAIDIALMDIKGKVLNVPIYELLGGKVNDSIRCYASQLQFGWNEDVGPRGTAKEYADICKYAMSEGYDAVKLDFTMYDRDKKDIPSPPRSSSASFATSITSTRLRSRRRRCVPSSRSSSAKRCARLSRPASVFIRAGSS